MKKRGRYKKIRKSIKKSHLSTKTVTYGVLAITFFLGLYFFSFVSPFSSKIRSILTLSPRAAIIDQGSLAPTAGPNPAFVKEVTAILKEAGFSVDYYPGEEVTVDFYRDLPTHGYDLIIQRTHAGVIGPPSDIPASEYNLSDFPKDSQSLLFTNEPYTITAETKYLNDLQGFRLVKCYYDDEDNKRENSYFGISPMFVTQSMMGKFKDTIILNMGCEGLRHKKMAEAFVQKGCKVYLSWIGPVSSDYADQATIHLLQRLLHEKLPVRKAVLETMKKVGPDPVFKAVLGFYPIEAGNYIL